MKFKPVWLLVSVFVATILFGFALLPAKTWFSQRSKLEAAKQEMVLVESNIDQLEDQLATLETDAEVERRARADFGLVFPGEESYRIVD